MLAPALGRAEWKTLLSLCLQPSGINAKNGGFEWFGCVQILVEEVIILTLGTEDKLGSTLKGKPLIFTEKRCNSAGWAGY